MTTGYKLPPLKWLMSFEAAARHLSFTAAAQELGLSQAAVSYQIKCLEGKIGFPLFDRKPRNLQLTDIGHAYLPSIRRVFDELTTSSAGLFGEIGQNTITVRVAISFMVLCLAPKLQEFKAAHPEININFWSSVWANSDDSVNADVDIRFGLGNWARL
ncbi:MAG: LysR family glycine cleavage system transcriptional activator [Gammaproteobacteria bacterium]|jgi:LysR family glycine cleavage system transcriptional activator